MSGVVSKTIATMLVARSAPVASAGPKTKLEPKGVLVALAVPALALAPMAASPTEASVKKGETSKDVEEKKTSLFKRVSTLMERKSTDKSSSSSSPIETLVTSMANLNVHVDQGEVSERHRRQLSSLSITRESTESTTAAVEEEDEEEDEDDFVEILSPVVDGSESIQLPGATKGANRGGRVPQQKKKSNRGSINDRIASHHPWEPCPDEEDMEKFRRRLARLPKYLQKVVLNYGGNTHREMLVVMSRIEANLLGSDILQVIYKGADDYNPNPAKPRKVRENPGVKEVYCRLCDDGHNHKTVGHAAAHLTERHWGLRPWRCMHCDQSFAHPDLRMSAHTDVCGAPQASTSANPLNTGHHGVYAGSNPNPSGQTPPELTAESGYRNPVFAPQPPLAYQQHQPPTPRSGSNSAHTPSPAQYDPYDSYSQPSLSPEVSPHASRHPYTHQLNPDNSPDHGQAYQIPSPMTYDTSPIGPNPADSASHPLPSRQGQRSIPNEHQMTTFPPPGPSRLASTQFDNRALREITYPSGYSYVEPTNGAQGARQTAPIIRLPLAQLSNPQGVPYDNRTSRMHPQAQRAFAPPALTAQPPNVARQPNPQVQATLLPTHPFEPLFDLSQSPFWPGNSNHDPNPPPPQ